LIRVLLADDHTLFSDGIVSLLSDVKHINIIGRAEDGRSLEKKYFELYPDVVLSDISMPIKNGPEAVQCILNKQKKAKVLFLSQHTGDDYIYSILKVGGLGLISKNCAKVDLISAIESVNKEKKFFLNKSEEELKKITKRFESNKYKSNDVIYDSLTNKQKEVLNLIGEGLSTEEIAIELKISKRTVETHRYRMMQTLELNTLTKLIKYALMHDKNS